jgi:hypothetical protein
VIKLGMTVLGSGLVFHSDSGTTNSDPTGSSGLEISVERPCLDKMTQRLTSVLTKFWHRTVVFPTRSICIAIR